MDTNFNDITEITHLSKVVGLRQVVKHLNQDKIKTIILATDADPDFEKTVLDSASVKSISVVRAGTKEQLATMCGIDKIATVIGLLK